MKHEWRKKEKATYLPKARPAIIQVPEYQFLCIEGAGNPNSDFFAECIGVLYSLSYAIKMTLKKGIQPEGYFDYTVYPLEGIWDLNEQAKENYDGQFAKDDLVFNLMIRQPDFVDAVFFQQMLELTQKKKPHDLLEKVRFEKMEEGKCVQMLHIGSYDNEPESFATMEAFAVGEKLGRLSKSHREIYLSDFRKVPQEKLKTILRFQVKSI